METRLLHSETGKLLRTHEHRISQSRGLALVVGRAVRAWALLRDHVTARPEELRVPDQQPRACGGTHDTFHVAQRVMFHLAGAEDLRNSGTLDTMLW